MSRLEELETEISQLSEEEYHRFADWFHAREPEASKDLLFDDAEPESDYRD